jgi:hypothetical protein
MSQVRVFLNLEDQVPVVIAPRNRVTQLYPQARGSLFVASYDSHGYGVTELSLSLILRPTVSRPLCLGTEALIWGLLPDFSVSSGFVLSDVRAGLLLTIAVGPRQRSNFRVRIS